MADDDEIRKPKAHEVGMNIEAMSVEELHHRVELLRGEILRLEKAIAHRQHSRAAADSLFKF